MTLDQKQNIYKFLLHCWQTMSNNGCQLRHLECKKKLGQKVNVQFHSTGKRGKKTTSKSFVNSPNPSLCRPNQYPHRFLVTHVRVAGFTNQ